MNKSLPPTYVRTSLRKKNYVLTLTSCNHRNSRLFNRLTIENKALLDKNGLKKQQEWND